MYAETPLMVVTWNNTNILWEYHIITDLKEICSSNIDSAERARGRVNGEIFIDSQII